MTYPHETKEASYAKLREIVEIFPATGKLVLLEDFNARVNSDLTTWGSVLGHLNGLKRKLLPLAFRVFRT